ncbi:MAG: HalOD1 output domain-containing protein [Haloarculaceae archaeon]
MATTQAGFDLYPEPCHRGSGTHRFGYDRDTTPPSMAVVAALSEVLGADPLDLDPIQGTVDADALDALVRVGDTTDGDVRVTFSLEGYAVTVHSYGVVAVAPSGHGRTDDRNGGIRRT